MRGSAYFLGLKKKEKVFVLQPLGNGIVAAQSHRGESEVLCAVEGSEEITPSLAPPEIKKRKGGGGVGENSLKNTIYFGARNLCRCLGRDAHPRNAEPVPSRAAAAVPGT